MRFRRPNTAADEVRRPLVPQAVWGLGETGECKDLFRPSNKALDAERASTRVTAARGRLRTAQGAFQLAGRRWRCNDNHNDSRAVRDGVEVKFRLARTRPYHSPARFLGQPGTAPARRHPIRIACEPALWFCVKKGVVGGVGTTSASSQAQLNDKCLKLDRIQVLGMHACQASRFSPTEKVCISLYLES